MQEKEETKIMPSSGSSNPLSDGIGGRPHGSWDRARSPLWGMGRSEVRTPASLQVGGGGAVDQSEDRCGPGDD